MDIRALANELTNNQIGMLMKIMEIDNIRDMMVYRNSLSKSDQKQLELVMALVTMEAIEDEIMNMETFPEAEQMLKNILKK